MDKTEHIFPFLWIKGESKQTKRLKGKLIRKSWKLSLLSSRQPYNFSQLMKSDPKQKWSITLYFTSLHLALMCRATGSNLERDELEKPTF